MDEKIEEAAMKVYAFLVAASIQNALGIHTSPVQLEQLLNAYQELHDIDTDNATSNEESMGMLKDLASNFGYRCTFSTETRKHTVVDTASLN